MPEDLKSLEDKIAAFKSQGAVKPSREEDARNVNMGVRAGTELVVSVAAGTLIGYGLDHWLGTKPLFLIIFLLAGVFAGFMNVYKITNNMGSSIGFAPLHKSEKDAKKSPEKHDG